MMGPAQARRSEHRALAVLLAALAWPALMRWLGARRARRALAAGDAPGVGTTCLSKDVLPYALAFVAGWYDVVCFKQYKCYANMMTGNTLNLCFNVGSLPRSGYHSDVGLLAAVIANFAGSFAFFKFLDMRMESRGSCTAVAPLVFSLFAIADHLRKKHPQSRWHILLLALAGGMVNSISQERAKQTTNMMTGHYQKLSSDLATWMARGALNGEQRRSAVVSMRTVGCFTSGVCVGMAAWNGELPWFGARPAISRHRFALIGAIYAAVLVLHELPSDIFGAKRADLRSSSEDDGSGILSILDSASTP